MNTEEAKHILIESIAEEMGIPSSDIKNDDTFFDLGMDSVSCIFVMERIENKTKLTLNPIYFWDYPDVGSFSKYISELSGNKS